MENTQEYSKELLALNEQYKQKALDKISSLESLKAAVVGLLKPHMKQEQVQYIASKFDELLSFITSYETFDHFNYYSLLQCYEFVEDMVKDQISAISLVDKELLTKTGSDLEKSRAYLKKYAYVFVDKLREIISFANHGKNLPLDDLYSQPETSQDWDWMRSITKYYEFSPKRISIENYQTYAGKVFFIVAAMGRSAELVPKSEAEVDEILQKALADPQPEYPVTLGGAPLKPEHKLDDLTPILLGRFLKYQRDPRKGITDGGFFMANPDYRIILALFNLYELPLVKFIRKAFSYQKVAVNMKHYLAPTLFDNLLEPLQQDRPRNLKAGLASVRFTFDQLTEDGREKEKDAKRLVMVRFLYSKKLKHLESGVEKMVEVEGKKIRIGLACAHYEEENRVIDKPVTDPEAQRLCAELEYFDMDLDLCRKQGQPYLSSNIRQDSRSPFKLESVTSPKQVTVNISKHLKKRITKPAVQYRVKDDPDLPFDCDIKNASAYRLIPQSEKANFERVVVHVHGGGFVAQTSFTHQAYLNPWVNEFNVPFFSIDYRLAPAAQFPLPVNDVIAGYLWILGYLEFVLDVKPRQIVAIGDSAGANLLVGLTSWCVINNVRKPDSLLLFYPAMGLDEEMFTPSLFYSLDDLMLNYSALRMCSMYYVGKGQRPADNFYMSSAITPHDILKKFPETHLFLSERDPLRDDGMRFALRASKSGANVRVHYLLNLSHALLSQSTGSGLKEAKDFMYEARKVIRTVLKQDLK